MAANEQPQETKDPLEFQKQQLDLKLQNENVSLELQRKRREIIQEKMLIAGDIIEFIATKLAGLCLIVVSGLEILIPDFFPMNIEKPVTPLLIGFVLLVGLKALDLIGRVMSAVGSGYGIPQPLPPPRQNPSEGKSDKP